MTQNKLKKSPTKLKKQPTTPTPTPTRALAIASFQSALLPQTHILPQLQGPTPKALSTPPPPDAPTTQAASALNPSAPPNEENSSPHRSAPEHRPPLPTAQHGGHWTLNTLTTQTALGAATYMYLSEQHHRHPASAPAHNPTVVASELEVCPSARDSSVGDAERQEDEEGGFPWGVDVDGQGGRCWCCGAEVIRGERCGECWAGRVVYL